MTSWKVVVGVDWASEAHQVCVLDGKGVLLGEKSFTHSGLGLEELASWLLSFETDPATVAVAIEVPHGPVVESLLGQGFEVYGINPKQLDRFRDRFSPAGAKDDRKDALVLASSLITDPERFRHLEVGSSWHVELREWSRIHESLQADRTRLVNQMRELMTRYYVQFLDLGDPGEDWLLALWTKASTPEKARRLKRSTVEKLLSKYRIRRIDAKGVLDTLKVPSLAVSGGTVAAASKHIALLVPRIQLVNRQTKEAHRQLEHLNRTGNTGDRFS